MATDPNHFTVQLHLTDLISHEMKDLMEHESSDKEIDETETNDDEETEDSSPDADDCLQTNSAETNTPDINVYQQKKTLAQGMMDLALLTANANQLRYVLESHNQHPYFYPCLTFISISIIFQIAVGVGLILNCRYNITCVKDICRAKSENRVS